MARILVVDDSLQVRGAVRRVLSRGGHAVWVVSDGAEALDLMEIVDFDLVVADVHMTGVDGMELLSRHQRRGSRAPAMVISAGGLTPSLEPPALAGA